jgi:hypothetical protein
LDKSHKSSSKGVWYHPEFFRTRAIKCLKEAVKIGNKACFEGLTGPIGFSSASARHEAKCTTSAIGEEWGGNRFGEKFLDGTTSLSKSKTNEAVEIAEAIETARRIGVKAGAPLHHYHPQPYPPQPYPPQPYPPQPYPPQPYGGQYYGPPPPYGYSVPHYNYYNSWAASNIAIANANISVTGNADVFEPLPSRSDGIDTEDIFKRTATEEHDAESTETKDNVKSTKRRSKDNSTHQQKQQKQEGRSIDASNLLLLASSLELQLKEER